MHQFTVPMGLMDFVPVIFFGVTGVVLLGDLYQKMSKSAFALFAAGVINVFTAGFLKALWKALYAAGICDFVAFEQMFLPVNSLGLLFVGAAMIWMLCAGKKSAAMSVVPVPFVSGLPFILMMVLGLGGMCAVLSILSARMKKAPVMALFIASFLLSMGMGYLSGQDSSLAWVNWAEQGINTASQLCLMIGTLLLHRAGLARAEV